VGAVRRVAHGAGGDEDGFCWRERRGEREQLADGGEAVGHAFFGETGSGGVDAGADADIERALRQRLQDSGGVAGGDEELDRVGADVDDGDGGGLNHGDTESTELKLFKPSSVNSVPPWFKAFTKQNPPGR